MSDRFLFVLWAGGGNVPPQLVLARRLAAQGHEVRVLAPAVLRGQIEGAGLVFEPYGATPEHDESSPSTSLIRDFEARTPIGASAAVRDRLLAALAGPIADDVLRIVRARPVDVIAGDAFLLGAQFAAESAGIPAAMLVHTVYPFPAPGMPPFGMGWLPARTPLDHARDAVGRFLFRRAYEAPLVPKLNAVRARLGLDPIRSFEDVMARAHSVLVLTSPAFDFEGGLPANVRYVGAQLPDPDWSTPWASPWPADDARPLVAVGLTTTYQAHEAMLQNVVDALGTLDVRAVVTTGAMDLGGVPPNVHVERWVPHARLFALADVVVSHAGLGTVHAALAQGRPLLCLPIGRDQPDNAARVVARGAGIRLGRNAKPKAIAAATERLLADGRYAEAARRLAAGMARDDAARAAPAALAALAADRTSAPATSLRPIAAFPAGPGG